MNVTDPHYVAVDPGGSGGLVWGSSVTDFRYSAMPESVHDMEQLIADILASTPPGTEVWMELITGYLNGIKANPKGMLSFGKNIGRLEMGFAAHKMIFRETTPVAWQKAAGVSGIRKGLLGQTEWKKYLRGEAQKRFPSVASKITLKTADAFLIFYALVRGNLAKRN